MISVHPFVSLHKFVTTHIHTIQGWAIFEFVDYWRNFVASLKGNMRGKRQVLGRKKLPHRGAEKLLVNLRRRTRLAGGYSCAVRGNAGMCERATWDTLAAATVKKSTTLSL